jgi:hypothetical protein
MLSWSLRRRLVYLGLVTLASLVMVAVVYLFAKPVPSCFDGLQNQDELGVDCGGACAKVCPLELKPIRVLWSRIFNPSTGRYDLATLVENPNSRYAARSFNYSVKVLDENNLLITTRRGQAFLNPGETMVIYDPKLEVGQRVPYRTSFSLDSPVWQRLDGPGPVLQVKDQTITFTSPGARLNATVVNESSQVFRNVQVVAVVSGSDENALAVSSTLVERLEPGQSSDLVFLWTKAFSNTPALVDFYPHFDYAQATTTPSTPPL